MDGVDAFHAAYRRGQVVRPRDDEYMDLILIPAILHIDPMVFHAYPLPIQERMRRLLIKYIAAGWGGNPETIQGA